MVARKYIWSLITVYMCYFTHGIQAIILSQNETKFFEQWGFTDSNAGAAAVSMAITATGFGKFLTVWIGGEVSDKIGRKKMAVAGGILYVLCFAGLLFTTSYPLACVCAFLAGVATSGFWDAALYPTAMESYPKAPGSSLIGIKLFVSLSGIIYPLAVVHFANAGQWHVNIWIPLILSIVCTVLALISPFVYDDQMKEVVSDSESGETKNRAQAEIEAAKARQRIRPSGLVNFITMFYAFVCMFIMYGAQQYTKSYGMNVYGMPEGEAAGLTSIYTAGSIIAVLFWAFMMAKLRWNPLKVVFIDAVFTAIALAIVLLVHNAAVIYVAIALLGFFAAGGALQTGLGVRQLFCPGPKGRNTGIYYTWMGLASCFLPFIVSLMTESLGVSSALYTMMGLLLGAAVLSVVMMGYLFSVHKKMYDTSAF